MVTSSKHRDHSINKHVIAVKLSEERVKELDGVSLSLIQKVTGALHLTSCLWLFRLYWRMVGFLLRHALGS